MEKSMNKIITPLLMSSAILLSACDSTAPEKLNGLDLIAAEGEGQKFIIDSYKSCMKRENDIKQCLPRVSYEANTNGYGGLLADVFPRIEKYEESKK